MRTKRTKQKQQSKKGGASTIALTPLTTREARALPKPHIGFEQWIEPAAEIYRQYGDELGKGANADLMLASLDGYESLASLQAETQTKMGLVDDTRLRYASTAWMQLLRIYRRAQLAAATNPDIARAIEPLEKWMKQKAQRKPAAAPTTPTT